MSGTRLAAKEPSTSASAGARKRPLASIAAVIPARELGVVKTGLPVLALARAGPRRWFAGAKDLEQLPAGRALLQHA